MLSVRSLSVSIGGREILRPLSFEVREGEWLMLAGPNGAGKTTLLRAISGALPHQGSALFEGRDLRGIKPRERARAMALLSQKQETGYAFTAEEVIRLGRYAHSSPFSGRDREGERAVLEAARLCGVEGLLQQSVLTLSGGELQRVFLAQVFAQDPKLLLLDEPANHLDLRYLAQIFDLISRWVRAGGRAVISVVHDLSLTRRYADTAALLREGSLLIKAPAAEALSAGMLEAAYGMDVQSYMRSLLADWQ